MPAEVARASLVSTYLGGLITLVMGLSFFLSTPAVAATSLELPSPLLFSVLADSVQGPAADPRWQCAPAAQESCPCVRFVHRRGEVILVDVERGDDGLRARRFSVVADGDVMVGEQLRVENAQGGLEISFERSASMVGDDDRGGLEVARVRFLQPREGRDGIGVEIILQGLNWFGPGHETLPATCENLQTEVEVSAPRRGLADEARFSEGSWEVDRFSLAGPLRLRPLGPARVDVAPRGFLPAEVFVDEGGARGVATFHLGEPPVSLRAIGDSNGLGGVGFAFWSTHPFCQGQGCRREAVTLDFLLGSQGLSGLELTGSAAVGSPRRHATFDGDGMVWALSQTHPALPQRLDRGTLTRDWQSQRAGLSVSGANYDLYLGGALWSATPGGMELFAGDDGVWDAWIGYGTRIELGAGARADLRLGHREVSLEAGPHRLSHLDLAINRVFGSSGRVFLRPTLRGGISMASTEVDQGILAASRGHLDVMADAGVGLRGELFGAEHRLTPRVLAGRRMISSTASTIDEIWWARDGELGETSFNFFGAHLDQRLRLGPGWSLEFPLGAIFVDDVEAGRFQVITNGSLRLSSSGPRRLSLGMEATCRQDCENWGLLGRGRIGWAPWLESVHIAGRGLDTGVGAPFFDHRLRSGIADQVGGITPGLGQSTNHDAHFLHMSRLRARGINLWGEVGYFDGDDESDGRRQSGFELGMGYDWPEFGWGLTARAGALPAQDAWAAYIGFRACLRTPDRAGTR